MSGTGTLSATGMNERVADYLVDVRDDIKLRYGHYTESDFRTNEELVYQFAIIALQVAPYPIAIKNVLELQDIYGVPDAAVLLMSFIDPNRNFYGSWEAVIKRMAFAIEKAGKAIDEEAFNQYVRGFDTGLWPTVSRHVVD